MSKMEIRAKIEEIALNKNLFMTADITDELLRDHRPLVAEYLVQSESRIIDELVSKVISGLRRNDLYQAVYGGERAKQSSRERLMDRFATRANRMRSDLSRAILSVRYNVDGIWKQLGDMNKEDLDTVAKRFFEQGETMVRRAEGLAALAARLQANQHVADLPDEVVEGVKEQLA